MDNRIYNKLLKAEEYYSKCIELEDIIDSINNKGNQIIRDFHSKKRNKLSRYRTWTGLSLIAALGSVIFLLLMIAVAMSGVEANAQDMFYFFILPAISVASFIAYIILSSKKKSVEKKFDTLYINSIKPQLEETEKKYHSAKEDLYKYKSENNCGSFLPVKYQNWHAVNYFIGAIDREIVDTLEDAIVLYEIERTREAEQERARKIEEENLRMQNYYLKIADEHLANQREINRQLVKANSKLKEIERQQEEQKNKYY